MKESKQTLWLEEEIVVREDGFLWIQDCNEEQPLLLHSTELLLQELYPSLSRNDIFTTAGHQGPGDPLVNVVDAAEESPGNNNNGGDEMDVDDSPNTNDTDANKQAKHNNKNSKDDNKIPPEYSVYQQLKRTNNLGGRIQAALLDLQYMRHRNRKEQNRERISREEAKVRALQHQQQRLLSQKSESIGDSNDDDDDEEDKDDNDDDNMEDAAEEEGVREPQTVLLARTINSIRALYPHLIPILNHPRRNDKKLIIQKTRYKSKRRAMCWILGTEIFDTTTCKLCISAHNDAQNILEGFIPVEDAQNIMKDICGGTADFWTQHWIQKIQQKANPQMLDPMTILTQQHGGTMENITSASQRCDKELDQDHNEDNTQDIQDRYRKAVNKLHYRVSKLLTSRFPKARVSIYGSCLSNLSLGKGADVDLSLWIPEADKLKQKFQNGDIDATVYEKDMKRFVYQVNHKLKNLQQEFRGMLPITRARVPVVKGTYNYANNPYSPDGSIK